MSKLLLEKLTKFISSENDMAAYEEVYHLLFPSLFSITFNILQNKETAEEIVSDVFLKIWHSRQHLSHVESLLMYIYRMTRNTALNEYEKQKKKRTIDISGVNEIFFLQFNDPEQDFISAELQAALNKAIRNLPPQCQLIFHLVKEDGLRYKEVADILGLSVNTVRNQLAIAVKKLYEQLSGS